MYLQRQNLCIIKSTMLSFLFYNFIFAFEFILNISDGQQYNLKYRCIVQILPIL